jgi:hypothetical protein
MSKQVFFDPQRKRWKRLRRIFDIVALVSVVVLVLFVIGLVRMTPLPELLLATPKRNYSPLPLQAAPAKGTQKPSRSAHRKTDLKPSEIILNSGEGLRAAYYVEDDPASYSSLKQHIRQIDLLFPEWIHVVTPDGTLTSYSMDNRPFSVVDKAGVHGVDHEQKVARAVAAVGQDTTPAEIFPRVNNYDPTRNMFLPSIGDFLTNRLARQFYPADKPVSRRESNLPGNLTGLRGDSRRGAAGLHGAARRTLSGPASEKTQAVCRCSSGE